VSDKSLLIYGEIQRRAHEVLTRVLDIDRVWIILKLRSRTINYPEEYLNQHR